MEDLDEESWEGFPPSGSSADSSEESPRKKPRGHPVSLASLFEPTAFEQSQAQQPEPARTVSPQWQVGERLGSPTPSEQEARDLMDQDEMEEMMQEYINHQ